MLFVKICNQNGHRNEGNGGRERPAGSGTVESAERNELEFIMSIIRLQVLLMISNLHRMD